MSNKQRVARWTVNPTTGNFILEEIFNDSERNILTMYIRETGTVDVICDYNNSRTFNFASVTDAIAFTDRILIEEFQARIHQTFFSQTKKGSLKYAQDYGTVSPLQRTGRTDIRSKYDLPSINNLDRATNKIRTNTPPVAETPKPTSTPTPKKEQTNTMSKISENETFNMAKSGAISGAKIVAAAGAQQLIKKVARKIVAKAIPEEHLAILDTPLGEAMIDLATPLAIHAIATNFPDYIPKSEYVAAACSLAYQGQIIKHGMKLTENLGDIMSEIGSELGELANIGSKLIASAETTVEEEDLVVPDFDKMLEKEKIGMKVTV